MWIVCDYPKFVIPVLFTIDPRGLFLLGRVLEHEDPRGPWAKGALMSYSICIAPPRQFHGPKAACKQKRSVLRPDSREMMSYPTKERISWKNGLQQYSLGQIRFKLQ